MNLQQVTNFANQLDAVGLRNEANAVDRFLQIHAGLLSYEDKPFVAKLAKILLELRSYGLQQKVQEDLTLPGSSRSLIGLTKSQVLDLTAKTLERFINDRVKEKYRNRYVGTRHEQAYREYINALEQTLRALGNTHLGPKDIQRRQREIGGSIAKLRSAIDRLSVFRREPIPGQEEQYEKSLKEVEKVKNIVHRQLDNLETALANRNEERIKDIQRLFVTRLFPKDMKSAAGALQDAVTGSYKALSRPKAHAIEKAISEKLEEGDYEDDEIAAAALEHRRIGRELHKAQLKYDLVSTRSRRAVNLGEYYQNIKKIASTLQVETLKILKDVETHHPQAREQLKKQLLPQYVGKYVPPKLHTYHTIERLLNTIAGDVHLLEQWLEEFLKLNTLPDAGAYNAAIQTSRNVYENKAQEAAGARLAAFNRMIKVAQEEEDKEEWQQLLEEEEGGSTEQPQISLVGDEPEQKKEDTSLRVVEDFEPQALYVTFAEFLTRTKSDAFGRGEADNFLKKIFQYFEKNLTTLSNLVKRETQEATIKFDKLQDVQQSVFMARFKLEQEVLWEMWRNTYVIETFQTIRAFFRPKDIEDKGSEDAYKDALRGFQQILSMDL